MAEPVPRPLLSICIPTCNRAKFLRVMLEALLPQVRLSAEDVEVWVLDNGSADQTGEVLQNARELGPFRVHKHPCNVGPLKNIIYGPLNLVTGEYCWVLGDHNLLRPGALATVLQCLRENSEVDAFYVNFRTATWPQHWPQSAVSGYDGDFDLVANPESEHGRKDHWSELLRSESSAGTQSYAHVVRSHYWKQFWGSRHIGRDYTSAETTYPHTVTIAEYCLHRPAFFLGTPVLTIFNGAQSWSHTSTRLSVYFAGFPDLLRTFRRLGLDIRKVRKFRDEFLLPNASRIITDSVREIGMSRTVRLFVGRIGFGWQSWLILALCLVQQLRGVSPDYRRWYLYNFRPARWIRNRV